MPVILFFLLFQYFQYPGIPYRNKEDFQVELKYDLRARPVNNPNQFNFDQAPNQKPKTGLLPYLIISVKIMNVTAEEARFRCEDNKGMTQFNKKLPKGATFMIDMGYIDDIKDQLAPNTYELFAVSSDKAMLNRIHLRIEKDGTFLVNGERRGKF